jgi:hypothetical protein
MQKIYENMYTIELASGCHTFFTHLIFPRVIKLQYLALSGERTFQQLPSFVTILLLVMAMYICR